MSVRIRDLLGTQLRFLVFRPVRISVKQDFRSWFAFVLAVTCLAGVGRYWDHPAAEVWQHLGLGSVMYIFCLASLLFVVVWPLKPENWEFRGVLVFVGLTSAPAILYAIPVERFVDLEAAQSINAWFLGVVAVWRVALLVRYLISYARLHWIVVSIVTVLVLSGIVFVLSLLNLEHVVFDLMAGIKEQDASPNDAAYLVVVSLAFVSLYAFPIAILLYVGAIMRLQQSRQIDS